MSWLHSFFKIPDTDTDIQPTTLVTEDELEAMKNAPRSKPSIVVVKAVETGKTKI